MASEPLREGQFKEQRVSEERLGRVVADLYELLVDEPLYIREVARRLKIPINLASYALKVLRRDHDNVLVRKVPMNQAEGSLAWQAYALHYVDGRTPESAINEKIANLTTLGVVGYECSVLAERVLENACVRRFGRAYITISDYNSKANDVVVPAVEAAFEVTVRTSNPVDRTYLMNKRRRLTRDFGEEYLLVVMAPRYRRDVESEYFGLRKDKRINIYHLPTRGFFPLFFRFWGYQSLFNTAGRPVQLVTMHELERAVDEILLRYIE